MKTFLRALFALVLPAILFAVYLGFFRPETRLPNHWHPFEPLVISDPITPVTSWKIRRARADDGLCLAALLTGADIEVMQDLEVSDQCHIRNRVRVSSLAGVQISPTETTCATALATALWLEHGVQPVARDVLGGAVTRMRTQGSYNCRTIAGSERMSQHATASALDVAGFTLANGQQVELIQDWDGDDAKSTFLRRVRDASCDWYGTTLGPDYNRAHADHFHLQVRGWGTCR